MARSDHEESAAMYAPSRARKRRRTVRLAVAALLAAIIALGASYALRTMNL
jgi:hypothetical protein